MSSLDAFERVQEERDSLHCKIESLTKFINSDNFRELPDNKRMKLREQMYVMWQYFGILEDRIKTWDEL